MTISKLIRRLVWIIPAFTGMFLAIRYLSSIRDPGSPIRYWQAVIPSLLAGWFLFTVYRALTSYLEKRKAGQRIMTVPIFNPRPLLVAGILIMAVATATFLYKPSWSGLNTILIWALLLTDRFFQSKLEVWETGLQVNGRFFRWLELESASWEASFNSGNFAIETLGIVEPRSKTQKLKLEPKDKGMLTRSSIVAVPPGYRDAIEEALSRAGLSVQPA